MLCKLTWYLLSSKCFITKSPSSSSLQVFTVAIYISWRGITLFRSHRVVSPATTVTSNELWFESDINKLKFAFLLFWKVSCHDFIIKWRNIVHITNTNTMELITFYGDYFASLSPSDSHCFLKCITAHIYKSFEINICHCG